MNATSKDDSSEQELKLLALTPDESKHYVAFKAMVEEHFRKVEALIPAGDADGAVASRARLARERAFCDPYCLRRYLRATTWKVDKSFARLLDTLQWRTDMAVHSLVEQHLGLLKHQASTGKMYVRGEDDEGHPVICMLPSREAANQREHTANLQYLVYTMERAVSMMDRSRGVEKLIILVDYVDYSMRNAPAFKTSKATLDILMNHYPERLYKAFNVSPPWAFWAFWKLISPFLDKVTRDKVIMVTGDEAARSAELDKHIPRGARSAAFGGTDQFDCKLDSCRDEYWKGVGDEAKQVSYVPPAGTAAEPSETDGREPEDVPADDTDAAAAAGSATAASTSQQVAP